MVGRFRRLGIIFILLFIHTGTAIDLLAYGSLNNDGEMNALSGCGILFELDIPGLNINEIFDTNHYQSIMKARLMEAFPGFC